MEKNTEINKFKEKSVYVICWAGSDRSKYIADELMQRGYLAEHGGVMDGQNYVTKEDLSYVGSIIFSSIFEKEKFDKDKDLKDFAKNNGIQIFVMNITESDKDRAHNSEKVDLLKKEVSSQLDHIGFKKLKNIK
jgi:hypothetical protein